MRRAFTWIEVLVCIAVISVAVSVTVPTIAQVRLHALTASCQMQQHSIGHGVTMLALSRQGRLPTGPIEVGGWFEDPDRGSPIELFSAYRRDLGLHHEEGWYGLGLIWKERLVDSGKVFYCPGRTRLGRGYLHAWPRSFAGLTPTDGKTRIVSAYAYRGGLTSQPETPRGPLRLDRHPGSLAIFADDPMYGAVWHERGYNVAFLDGHVSFAGFDYAPVPDTRLWLLWQEVKGYWY